MSKAKSSYNTNLRINYSKYSPKFISNQKSKESILSSKFSITNTNSNDINYSRKKIITDNLITPNKALYSPKISNFDFEFGELGFNVNDDWKTLILKNGKLKQVVIHASNKVADLVFITIIT